MDYVLEVLPSLLSGAVVSLQVFFRINFIPAFRSSFAFLMQIRFKPLQWLLHIYVLIMRGTPLLLQLIFVYYVLPSVGITFDRMPAVILAFAKLCGLFLRNFPRGLKPSLPANTRPLKY